MEAADGRTAGRGPCPKDCLIVASLQIAAATSSGVAGIGSISRVMGRPGFFVIVSTPPHRVLSAVDSIVSTQTSQLPLVLAESIRTLFSDSGATQAEQFAALEVVSAMVSLSGAPLDQTDPQERQQSAAVA